MIVQVFMLATAGYVLSLAHDAVSAIAKTKRERRNETRQSFLNLLVERSKHRGPYR